MKERQDSKQVGKRVRNSGADFNSSHHLLFGGRKEKAQHGWALLEVFRCCPIRPKSNSSQAPFAVRCSSRIFSEGWTIMW